ncbi:acetylglutamate kinase [soil metagenome]
MAIVIKYGDHAMTDLAARRAVAREIGALAGGGLAPVVVHGGGPFIKAALDAAGLEHRFVRGLRVTSAESLPYVEQALTLLNKQLAQDIGAAVGLTGRDAHVLTARTFDETLGFVGRVTEVNVALLEALLTAHITPVLACLAENEAGDNVLNVNADEVAGGVAGALKAPVVFLTDVAGVLNDPSDPDSLLTNLTKAEVEARIEDGRISGGMIPKVDAALGALEQGAVYAVIADGRVPEKLRMALEGKTGTRLVR